MLIGIDFDNTIVCYDRLFYETALEADLIPADLPATKSDVRFHLVMCGLEKVWTELQGQVYGPKLILADPFPGVLEFFRTARSCGVPTTIISHKTRFPYAGRRFDLHLAAQNFLVSHGFYDDDTGLTEENVFFEQTLEKKVERIKSQGCTYFIDDLTDVLDNPNLPAELKKILFDPSDVRRNEVERTRVTTWSEATKLLIPTPPAVPDPTPAEIAPLLASAGLGGAQCRIERLSGGRNNRAYVVTMPNGARTLLKWYYEHPEDDRKRLAAEYEFASYCRRFGIDAAPLPLARDDARRFGLYEFLEGTPHPLANVERRHVEQALQFVCELQRYRRRPDTLAPAPASEACFSIGEHLDCIERRRRRVVDAATAAGSHAELRRFVNGRFGEAWPGIAARIEQVAGASLHTRLQLEDCCVSPSDFGFHNALQAPDGRLRFFDFEYAGWDDPAKLLCDFFCQVEVPVPPKFAPWFTTAFAAEFPAPAAVVARAELLYPAYLFKWCLIVLNEFLPTGAARRAFGHVPPSPERLAAQLAKAEKLLDRLEAERDRSIFTATTTEPT